MHRWLLCTGMRCKIVRTTFREGARIGFVVVVHWAVVRFRTAHRVRLIQTIFTFCNNNEKKNNDEKHMDEYLKQQHYSRRIIIAGMLELS